MAAQVLPTPLSQYPHHHMSYGPEMLSNYTSMSRQPCSDSWELRHSDFEALSTSGNAYCSEPQHRSLLVVSPAAHTSEPPFRRRSSHSPQGVAKIPLLRDRTPIRHHRPDVTRDRSHSRSEMLLTYATEQNQLQQTQSLPSIVGMPSQASSSIPHIYSVPGYNMSPPLSNYSSNNTYFNPVGPGRPSPSDQNANDFALQHNESDGQAFYPVSRATSHGSAMSAPPPVTPSALYLSGQQHHNQQPLPSIGMTMQPFPPVPLTLESSPAEIEIMPARPKPQCWDHGCNGRQFSTFSNLLRHQREKSGSAVKATCPHCGTEFTRTTARNGHMSGGKCKGRPDGEGSLNAKQE
jgi:hypothetical protein